MNPRLEIETSPNLTTAAAFTMDDVLCLEEEHPPKLNLPRTSAPAVVIGKLVGLAHDGAPLVDFVGNRYQRPLLARSTAMLESSAVGGEVALLFEQGDFAKPIIMGVIYQPPTTVQGLGKSQGSSAVNIEATADGERVLISAEKEIELRCGQASITLTRAGKILIRGEYVLSRSAGVNRIKGGSVQIN